MIITDEWCVTMPLLTRRLDLDVNSDPSNGAENVSANNARFEITLEQPIRIPARAIDIRVKVEEATVWNTVFNISAVLGNNKMYIFEDGVGNNTITIPDGTYSSTTLSNAINREYETVGSSGLVSLEEDLATQKVILVIDGTLAGAGGASVDFTPADTFRDVVGFNSQVVGPFTAVVKTLADNEAAFNNIEYFKIHWDGGQGFRTNNKYNGTIARVNITASPGSQVVSTPFNPPRSEAQRWAGTNRNHLVFWLTNELDIEVDTGETWSARLVLEWEEYVEDPHTEIKGSFRKRRDAFQALDDDARMIRRRVDGDADEENVFMRQSR